MKKKVAIITIISKNYGNRLQNFALQEVLINLGYQVKTIPVYPYHIIRYNIKYYSKKILKVLIGKFPDVVWDEFDKNIRWGKTVDSDKKIANKYNNSDIVGSKVNGIKITEISEHIISRTYARNVSFEDVQDTLKKPIKYGKIRANKTQQINGKNCTIIVNTETGKLVTVYPKKTKKE